MSTRGFPLLMYDDYSYYRKQNYGKKSELTRWACSTHHTSGCRAFITTNNDEIIRANCNHNHERSKKFTRKTII